MNLKTKLCALWARPVEYALFCLVLMGVSGLSAATVPPGFTETVIPGPSGGNWNEAVGLTFENNGRMYVWERGGRVRFKDPGESAFTLLLDISQEVGNWGDHGLLGFALDPDFRVNGFIYLLYVVDRHHLLNFGSPGYNPNSNEYNAATIGRLTRYSCMASNGFRSVDLASRLILIGETKGSGIPICSETHGVGSLVFGEDGSLLVSCGDGASPFGADLGGAWTGSYAPQGLADGILRPKEDVGAFRCQLVDCLAGKVLRVDAGTGNGLPSNPFYDGGNPRGARSRVWALGLRNPCRMALRAETGSHVAGDGRPGVLYVGDVGWNDWECVKVVRGGGENSGWPIYEGLAREVYYGPAASNIFNQDAPNPFYPTNGCNQYFSFDDLLREDTLDSAGQPPFANPCNAATNIPSSIPQFLHTRPALDWNHASAITRTPIFGGSGEAQIANVGGVGSPVSGTQFKGNCAMGGTWYNGTNFPVQYQNTYFFADWGQGIVKRLTFDLDDKPVALSDFANVAGAVVCMVQHPVDGSLYYISYDYNNAAVKQLSYTGNRTPVAAASADVYYGPSPLTVQFSSNGSSDPDGQAITYSWNFGDGSDVNTLANASHSFSAAGGGPTNFVVSLTVMDSGGLSAQTSLMVAVNNTPPNVTITSPVNGALYSPSNETTLNLSATVSDAESGDGQLSYLWQTLLHHNNHEHLIGSDTNHVTSTVLSPVGCDGINIYFYEVKLTVTDPTGLATLRGVRLYADCGGPDTPPVISDISNQTIFQNSSTAPLAFTVGDVEIAAANLQLSATSSNPALVPNGNIIFGGSGSNRTVTVSPAGGQTGTATITVTLNDGPNNTSDSFVLTVNPSITLTTSFTNGTAITIPDSGSGTPYPSTINVSGMSGTISNVTLSLRNLSHTWASDIDVLLVGPAGQKVLIFSDVGDGFAPNNVTVTLSDGAASVLPGSGSFVSGNYRPTNYTDSSTGGDNFPGPAPGTPYGGTFSTFNGTAANGTWSLYLRDDGAGDQGSFAGGWSLTLTTVSATGSAAPTMSDIANQSTTVNTPTTAIPFSIADADTPVGNLTLSKGSSNVTLVPTTNIVFGGSGTNRTVTVSPATNQTGTTTITVSVSDGTNLTSDTFVLTVNAVNTPPTISTIANQTVNEDTSTAVLNFTVGDAETSPGSLTMSKGSSNPALVPLNNIVFGGAGANRTVTVTPAANQNGSATITVGVSDGQYGVSTNFVVTVNAVNDPPSITGIANQTLLVNETTGPLNFTIGDVDTPVVDLTLSKGSSNPILVPTDNLVLEGSGTNRTVTVTPATNQTGTATITLSVSDGTNSASTNFVVTVNAANTPPTITAIESQAIDEDTSTAGLSFTVGDAETAAGNLTLSKASSNPTLVPTNNIVFVGSGSKRTVTVTPATNQNGTATLTVSVSDGQNIVSTSFMLTVNAVNDPPTITGMANQTINMNGTNGPLSFTIGDIDTPAGSLTLSGESSNPMLVPNGNIIFGGSGINRTVSVTPATNQTGTASITVSVSDAQFSARTSFVLTVSTLFTVTKAVTNTTAITVPDGAATPYPSTINVTGVGGTNSNVTVTVRNVSHTLSSDLDMLLVGPTGKRVLVFSDVGSAAMLNATVTLSDAAASKLPNNGSVASGTFKPTDFPPADTFPAAAPSGPYEKNLSAFNGESPNGTWSLYVFDDAILNQGSLAGGWSLAVTTVSPSGAAPTISDIADQITTVNTTTATVLFTINDVDTPVGNLTLSKYSSNPTLVPTNNIVFGGAGSSRTVSVTPAAGQMGTATIAVMVNDGTNSAGEAFVLTVNPANTPPTLAPVSNSVLNAGQILSFTNSASDTDDPPQVLTFTLINFPTGATLGATSGLFTWRPAVAQADTTNFIQLKVADNGSPVMSATQSFTVTVNTLAPPSVLQIDLTNSQLRLLITGDAGPDYTVQTSTDLTTWANLFTTNSPTLPFTWTTNNASSFSQRFFRILLEP